MGTSKSNTGGTGGAWTGFKRSATAFVKHGGQERAGRALSGYVAAMGGVAGAMTAAAAGAQAAQSLGALLYSSMGPTGLAGGLEAVGLGHLVGQDRFTVLSEILTAFVGTGSDLDAQAARDALLDVVDDLLPEDGSGDLNAVQLDEATVADFLCRFMAALVYNLAIPVIDHRLTQLQDQSLAKERDNELREFITALVRLRIQNSPGLGVDWRGQAGGEFVDSILRVVYEQLEAWS